MKRKILTTFLTMFMMFSATNITSFAAENVTQSDLNSYYDNLNTYSTSLSLNDFLDVAQYAYRDIDLASDLMKEKIVNAREEIILNTTWTIDNQCWTYDENGERVDLPEFYDIFPADWDLPKEKTDNTEVTIFADMLRSNVIFNDSVPIRAVGSSIASDFHTWSYAYPHVTNVKATAIPGGTYNVGFTTNGISVGSLVKQTLSSPGLTCSLGAAEGNKHGARVSTYSTTGYATMVISYE